MTHDVGHYTRDDDGAYRLDFMPFHLFKLWDANGRPRGQAFVDFAKEDDSAAAFFMGCADDDVASKLADPAWVEGFLKRSEGWQRDRLEAARELARSKGWEVLVGSRKALITPKVLGEAHSRLRWHGEADEAPQPMLVADTLPETGVASIAGQWAAGKTFVAVDLCASVTTGMPFFGKPVIRTGGVLWLAGEGEHEVFTRFEAARAKADVESKRLPFASQRVDTSLPILNTPGALAELKLIVDEARSGIEVFGEELALIVIDTVGSLTTMKDDHAAAEVKKLYAEVLRPLARYSEALVVIVDHYGKNAENGIAGTYAKGSSADAILAVLNEDGNRRAVLDKTRLGPTGRAVPFVLQQVPIGDTDRTTCVVEWLDVGEYVEKTVSKAALQRAAWSGKARVLKDAIEASMIEHGETMRPFSDGSELRAVALQHVRSEFYAAYPSADGSDKPDAKRKAFGRLLDAARAAKLIGSREIAGVDWLWFVKPSDEPGPDRRDTS